MLPQPRREAAAPGHRSRAGEIAKSLDLFLKSEPLHKGFLELSRVLFRSAKHSGNAAIYSNAIRLSDDLIKLTEEYYHNRDYPACVECGKSAIEERPGSINARSYLIRGLIQLENFPEANVQITELMRYAPPRDVHFLRGLMERRKNNYSKAISEFDLAIKSGRRGAAVSREIAQCYFFIHDLPSAKSNLEKALERHGENRYIVDLWAQIAAAQKNEEEAMKALARLEIIDKPIFYFFRKSRVELQFGKVQEARASIRISIDLEPKPPFHIVAQAAICEMRVGDAVSAEKFINKLDSEYHDIRRDVRSALRCKLEILRKRAIEAVALSERFGDKTTRHYQIVRLQALKSALNEGSLGLADRTKFEAEVKYLERAVEKDSEFDISEIDNF